jgi:uroporphyrinogen-III synthase
MRVLVTRPQPDAARTAARLEAMGHEAVVDPLLTLEAAKMSKVPAGRFAALAATSANALRVAGAMVEFGGLRTLPLFVVGSHSADAAHEAGFRNVTSAGGDAAALAALLSQRVGKGGRVLHLAGEERAQELGELLAPAGIGVDVLIVYRMRAAGNLGSSRDAIAGKRLDAVLHYSPRSAATFVALVEAAGLVNEVLKLRQLCLSRAVAKPLADLGAKVEVAKQPNENALLALLDS